MPEHVATPNAPNLECTISKIDGKFYWASRRNTPLVLVEGPAFDTYVAANGAGYVRVIRPEAKQAASAMSETEKRFDYVEHIVIGLRSVTYYGLRQGR